MCTKRIYQVDYNDKVIGEFIPIEEHPIYRAIQKIKQRKIEEIRIDMEKYDITLEDLKKKKGGTNNGFSAGILFRHQNR